MIRYSLICLFVCVFVLLPERAGAAGCEGNVEQLHLSCFNESTMVAMWISKKAMIKPTVRYFKGQCSQLTQPSINWMYGYGTVKTYNGYDGFIQHVFLRDLERDSTYCYSAGDRECPESNGWSVESQFKTTNDVSGHFAAFADAGTWGDVIPVMHTLAADSDVSMVIHAGDLSYGKQEDIWDTFGSIYYFF